jgi:lambda repressor-like predicted transcriptional regulator
MPNSFKYASDNIKLVLSFKKWTQNTLCRKSGITMVTLRRRLKTNEGWSMLEAVNIAKALGMSVQELFFTRMMPNGNKEEIESA